MEPSRTPPKLLRFGVFEVDLSARQLRNSGRRVDLQDQPFQVLALLLQYPGEIVGREQLREALWPADTYVEFDQSLNTAIKKIRRALGDSAEHPRFIETLPRKGYRFIAPVSGAPRALAPEPRRISRAKYWIAASLALVLAVATTVWFMDSRTSPEDTIGEIVPFTAYPGMETEPSFAPDGVRVAFSWDGKTNSFFSIYVKQLGVEKPLRLTAGSFDDRRPAWSPDGREVAFVRSLPEEKLGIFVVPGIGGREKKVAEIRRNWGINRPWAPAWTPDGQWLAFPDRDSDSPADETSSIYALCPSTGERRRLTQPPAGLLDAPGSFSPDGQSLVFRRGTSFNSELYLLRLSQDLRPAAEPARLTFNGLFASGPAWTPDERHVLYVSIAGEGVGSLWRLPVRPPGKPRRLAALGDGIRTLAVSAQKHRLVYEKLLRERHIWRIALDPSGRQTEAPVQLIASTSGDGSPGYSPDGRSIAFASRRSGHAELWICASDGSDPVQLTHLKATNVGPPRWSPDGRQIFFDSDASGNFDLYVVQPDGTGLRPLTNQPADEALPSLSTDGRWIYFVSSRSSRWEIWKMPRAGGEALPVTANGGYVGFESPDGRYLYYSKTPGVCSLWRCSTAGGPEQEVAAPLLGNSLAASPKGIYFARPPIPGGGNRIERYNFATGKITPVATTPKAVAWFLNVSWDQRFLLYSQTDQTGSDLMLVDNLTN